MARLSLGIDLGGTNARAAVVDADAGTIVAAHREPLQDRSPAAVVEVIRAAAATAAAAAGTGLAAFRQAGVGVAGQCLGATGVVMNAPNLGWREVPVGDLLRRALGIPVRVANDLSAAAWGERCFGAARGIDDAALVFVGSGVGSGLVLGGRLHDGATGVAGEFGHIKVRPIRAGTPIRRCGCGEWSCLEAYTSGVNVAARVREEIAAGADSRVLDLAGGDAARITAGVVDLAYEGGDAYAVALWNEVGEMLGTSIANLATLLNPARVILGGGVLLGAVNLSALVRRHLDEKVSRTAARALTVEQAWLGDDAGVIGAALLEQG
ncbi:MAG TPA: ROK family protein [Anaeromyxobacteraceae bacterium]|nr:ROK family protein [Anaeromyxobacteraceae bacterium]